jgi:hypothetical protein
MDFGYYTHLWDLKKQKGSFPVAQLLFVPLSDQLFQRISANLPALGK